MWTPTLPAPTEDDARAFLSGTPAQAFTTPDALLRGAESRKRVAAFVYAGANPMQAHQHQIKHGGLVGMAEMFINLSSAAAAKFKAGQWLVIARRYRAEGQSACAVRHALGMATTWRREAARRAGFAQVGHAMGVAA